MSRLEVLLQQLCPDGVEFKVFEDVLTIKNRRDYKQFGKGKIPVYGSGGIMAYIDTAAYDKPSVLIPRKGSLDKLCRWPVLECEYNFLHGHQYIHLYSLNMFIIGYQDNTLSD